MSKQYTRQAFLDRLWGEIKSGKPLVMTGAGNGIAAKFIERAGVDGELLFETLSRGSADSFTLRKHGMQYMVKGDFPDDVFPVTYSIKDIGYALQLAQKHDVDAAGARLADKRLREAEAAGYGQLYCPVMYKLLDS